MMDVKKLTQAIAGEGHIGFPKEATAQLGTELNVHNAQIIKDATEKFIIRKDYECYVSHPLPDKPWMIVNQI